MTKQEANVFKKNHCKAYTTYFSAKAGTMSVRVYSYINNAYNEEEERKALSAFYNETKAEPFSYEIKRRTYQGFIHDTCVIVK